MLEILLSKNKTNFNSFLQLRHLYMFELRILHTNTTITTQRKQSKNVLLKTFLEYSTSSAMQQRFDHKSNFPVTKLVPFKTHFQNHSKIFEQPRLIQKLLVSTTLTRSKYDYIKHSQSPTQTLTLLDTYICTFIHTGMHFIYMRRNEICNRIAVGDVKRRKFFLLAFRRVYDE